MSEVKWMKKSSGIVVHKVSLSHKIFDLAELNKKYLAGKERTIGCHTCKKVKDNTPRTMVH